MKYIQQCIAFSTFLASVLLVWMSGGSANQLTIMQMNIVIKWINVFGFAGLMLLSVMLYFYSVIIEFGAQKKCYTKFQWSLIAISAISFSFAVTTYNWIESIGPAYSLSKVDIIFAITDFGLVIFFVFILDMLTNIFFGRSFFPFSKRITARKGALEILVDEGTISESKRDEVLATQKKGEEQ